MSNLTRKDIWQTIATSVSAYVLAIGIVGVGIQYFVALADDLEDQQEQVVDVKMQMLLLQQHVASLQSLYEARDEEIQEILEWVRSQQTQ